MKTYKCPKKCSPAKGTSNDSIFLRGSLDWQDEFAKKLNKFPGIKVFKAKKEIDYSWDVDMMRISDVAAFNFTGFSKEEILENLFLFLLPSYIRFKPEVLVYINSRNKAREIVKEFRERLLSPEFEEIEKLDSLEKRVFTLFSYLKEDKMLVKYVKNKRGHKIGCVVAIGRNQIGWSLCKTKLDRFDKQMALEIATGRADNVTKKGRAWNWIGSNIPPTILPHLVEMVERANRYYK